MSLIDLGRQGLSHSLLTGLFVTDSIPSDIIEADTTNIASGLVLLDSEDRLPAVDGSQLTGVNASSLSGITIEGSPSESGDVLTYLGEGAAAWALPVLTGPAGSEGAIQFNSSNLFGADSNLVWDNSNKRLGIGTSSPGDSLQVVGTITVDRVHSTLIYGNDGNPNGAEAVTLHGGNQSANLGASLVLGGAYAGPNGGNTTLSAGINQFGAPGASLVLNGSGGGNGVVLSAGDGAGGGGGPITFRTGTGSNNGGMDFNVGNTLAINILPTGNIGVHTYSPLGAFQVATDSDTDNGNPTSFSAAQSVLAGNEGNDGSIFASYNRGSNTGFIGAISPGTSDRNLVLIGANVGVGVTAPAYKLDVSADVNVAADHTYFIGGEPATNKIVTTLDGNVLVSMSTGFVVVSS